MIRTCSSQKTELDQPSYHSDIDRELRIGRTCESADDSTLEQTRVGSSHCSLLPSKDNFEIRRQGL